MIRYSITSSEGDYFSIEAASGLVLLAKPLDRGLHSQYSLSVTASDLGTPSLSSTTHLQVLVVDVNDNPPEFSSRSYHALVSESVPVGTEVIRVSATSAEDGNRPSLTYSIIAGNEFGKFAIDTQTGTTYKIYNNYAYNNECNNQKEISCSLSIPLINRQQNTSYLINAYIFNSNEISLNTLNYYLNCCNKVKSKLTK